MILQVYRQPLVFKCFFDMDWGLFYMILKYDTVYNSLHQELTDPQWRNTPEPDFLHQFGPEQIRETIT